MLPNRGSETLETYLDTKRHLLGAQVISNLLSAFRSLKKCICKESTRVRPTLTAPVAKSGGFPAAGPN